MNLAVNARDAMPRAASCRSSSRTSRRARSTARRRACALTRERHRRRAWRRTSSSARSSRSSPPSRRARAPASASRPSTASSRRPAARRDLLAPGRARRSRCTCRPSTRTRDRCRLGPRRRERHARRDDHGGRGRGRRAPPDPPHPHPRRLQVLEAPTAPRALASGRARRRIDLLLTDVVMPGMSGKDLTDRLRPSRVFMSGYTDNVMDRYGLDGRAVVHKPFNAHSLLGAVRSALDDYVSPRAPRRPAPSAGPSTRTPPRTSTSRPKRDVALHLEPPASTQRRRAAREARLEVAAAACTRRTSSTTGAARVGARAAPSSRPPARRRRSAPPAARWSSSPARSGARHAQRRGALEHADRRAHRRLELDHLGDDESRRVDRLAVHDHRQPQHAVALVERPLQRAQVDPDVVALKKRWRSMSSKAAMSSSGVCAVSRSTSPPSSRGAPGGRPCGPTPSGRSPPTRTAAPRAANQARMRGSSTAPRLSEFDRNR